ncbi:PREDICTED: uncharacterized protein LOC104743215 [Camelina sativa]|uniref:Uncharacterized protein LOC104743215 n=1 Tax=Camelina sativa TaxID=90675 RepID=A0ABM0VXP0_CAMSA|nr:PREDICTED: uncharacterized protein LOC104743215 [Camelina sativa]
MSEEDSVSKMSSSLTSGSKARVESARRRIDSYDLSAGDNPRSVISQPQLRGPNYDEWAMNLRLALRWANNAMVVSWIRLTVAPDLNSSLSHHEISHDLWSQIQKRFSVKNGQRVQRIKTELANCQQKGSAVEAYYGKLTKLWTSLADFQRAKMVEEIAKEREEDKLHQFLMGLDESLFGAVKSSLLSRDPLPSVDEAYQVVSQDEESKRASRLLEARNEGASFAVQSTPRMATSSQLRDPSALCTSCGRKGHLADHCFRKISYPWWWGDRPRSKLPNILPGSSGTSTVDCRVATVPPKRVETPQVHHVATSSPVFMGSTSITEADRVGFSGLRDQEWKKLKDMLNTRKASTNDHLSGKFFIESWNIDTGASNHMTGSLDFLLDVCDMAPMFIKLSDGRFTISTKQGTVSLRSHLRLLNVDRITQTVIGAGEQDNGLYFYRGMASTAVTRALDQQPKDFAKQVKTIRRDNGSEFLSLGGFFRERGIIHETSCVGTPQQNGRVKRKRRHILNVAWALRFQAHLPVEFWSYCVLTACYLINRKPTVVLQGKTPFEMLYNRPPPMNHLQVFGCLCYAHNERHGGDKFASQSNRSVFLGYPYGKKGWKIYDLESGAISTSRDVVFLENEYPFAEVPLESHIPLTTLTPRPYIPDDEDDVFVSALVPTLPTALADSPRVEVSGITTDTTISDVSSPASPPVSPTPSSPESEVSLSLTSPISPNVSAETYECIFSSVDDDDDVVPMGKGCRPKFKSKRLDGYVTNMTHLEHDDVLFESSWYPIDSYVDCSQFLVHHRAFLAAITAGVIPRTYAEAFEDENWREAVRVEIIALEDQGTWTAETLPPGKKALGCKWVFTLKCRSDRTLVRYKARLVVLSNNQTEGLDYKETFALVCKMMTVRSFLEVAVSRDWEMD